MIFLYPDQKCQLLKAGLDYYGLVVASHAYVGWPDFKMVAPINVLVFTW